MSYQRLVAAWVGLLAVSASLAPAAVHLYKFFPNEVTPDQPPWNWNTAADDPGDVQTVVPGSYLTLGDADASDPGRRYTRNIPGDVNALTVYESRARLRVTSYTGSKALYTVFIDEGSGGKTTGWGADLSGTTQRFFMMNTSSGFEIPGTIFSFNDTHFHDVLYAKVSDGFGGFNTIISVDGAPPLTLAYTSANYTSGSATANLFWGLGTSPPAGTADLVGQTFGFNETAPQAPEPGSFALLCAGLAILLRRRAPR